MSSETARLLWEAVIVTLALSAVGAGALYLFVQSRRQSPNLLRQMQQLINETMRQNRELSDRLTAIEQQRSRDYLERQRDHAVMQRLLARVATLEEGVRRLTAQIERRGDKPEWILPPAEDLKISDEPIDDVALYRSLIASFNIDELNDLAFQLGIDPESLEGKRKDSRARSLVTAAERRDLLPELIDVARQLRPDGRF